MNEPAPFAPEAMQHAPTAPPAPPAPPAPTGFAMPADPAAALDVTAPLMMQPPGAAPAMPAAPAMAEHAQPQQIMPSAMSFQELAAAPAQPAHHAEHPQSLAMPAQAGQVAHHAMPAGFDEAPAAVGGAASAEDLAERAAFAQDTAADAPAGTVPEWASPGWALVLAMFALTWQLVSYYARDILPGVKASGTLLSNFDEIVGNAPLVGSSLGGIVGMVLGFGGLILMLLGVRAGLREPVLQGVIGLLSVIALAATVLLPKIAG
jgi:hypothetical protein